MIHIVFETANIAVLQQAIELDETIQGTILEIKDDYAVGPLGDIYATEGYQLRRDWWKSLLEFSPYTEQLDLVDDKLTVHHLLKQLDEEPDTEVWIWMAQNAHDVCGYYWLMSQLKDYQGRVQVLYLNNLPFINEKGQIFYPSYLHEIQPKEFLKAKRLARPITLSEFEVDPDEWKKHCQESAMVRFLEGGKKIIGKEVSFFDKDILAHINSEPQKLSKILTNTLSKMKVKTGDVFLVWRIRELINEGKLEAIGDWNKSWKDISVKMQGDKSQDTSVEIAE
ncbi:MAG: DUF1835 domain-containing protein [Sediminibacterium sp. Gen4]|jgi:hypothetical protein|uniref:DUF1835 domain-containing protein n=1 Tax=unclassified Sediminibacterium TaxID=2635961 RepID=UPI0015BA0D88|nr:MULTISPECIES: DUF1835 domain-containing protein [unclassified Sediminibacterium]MBW0164496.1 DUF1835 domain-containing protein [Sediminibacterium sp.]NWK67020.1 DUF1835 domain-containing protein [Sediminibacterium sp. Gen4]